MCTAEQSSTELRIAVTQAVTDPARLGRKLGRIYRLILDYDYCKQAAAQVGAQDQRCEAAPRAS